MPVGQDPGEAGPLQRPSGNHGNLEAKLACLVRRQPGLSTDHSASESVNIIRGCLCRSLLLLYLVSLGFLLGNFPAPSLSLCPFMQGLGILLGLPRCSPLHLGLSRLDSSGPALLLGRDRRTLVNGDLCGRDNVLDNVALVFRSAPAGGNGYDITSAQGVVGVVDKILLGFVEVLRTGRGLAGTSMGQKLKVNQRGAHLLDIGVPLSPTDAHLDRLGLKAGRYNHAMQFPEHLLGSSNGVSRHGQIPEWRPQVVKW